MNKNTLFPHGFPQRGEIYQVDFKKTGKGKEIAKKRPALIVSNESQNEYGDYLIVAPLTSRNLSKVRSFELLIEELGLTKPSKVLLNQIRSIDKEQRIIEYLGKVGDKTMDEVDQKLKLVLALK
jgi:mRNA interferase MazF